jgi:hypothetical protein
MEWVGARRREREINQHQHEEGAVGARQSFVSFFQIFRATTHPRY